jgi:hypothetical protein
MVQRGFALGVIGVLGAMFIAAPASGSTAQEEPEGIQSVGAEERGDEQALSAEEQEAMRAWVASMAEASPMGDTLVPKYECYEPPSSCPDGRKCFFPEGKAVCAVTQCGEGKCGLCPEFLSKLIFKGWCAYGCLSPEKKMLGGALVLKHQFKKDNGNTETYCVDRNGKVYDKDGKPIW